MQCKRVAKIEQDLHKILGKARYKKNREFFEISLIDAKRQIEQYFKRKSDLDVKREQEYKLRIEKEERIKKATEARNKYEQLIISGIESIFNSINSNSHVISNYLESKLPADKAVAILHPYKRKSMPGRILSQSGWKATASYAYSGGSKQRREL